MYPKVFTDADRAERRSHNYVVFGRLRQGTDLATANAEMGGLVTSLAREHPQDLTGWGVNVVSAHADRVRLVRPVLLVLLAAVAAVLLIACGNLANLQLVRAARRAQEIAVRVAIGASRARIASLLLAESGILCACGGAAGLTLAALALGPIVAAAPIALPFADTIQLDGWTIAASVAVTAGCAILIGLVPAVQLARAQSMTGVHGARVGSTVGQRRVRELMIAAQCALSLVLIVGSALLVRSMTNLAAVPHGFDPANLVTIRLNLPSASTRTMPRTRASTSR